MPSKRSSFKPSGPTASVAGPSPLANALLLAAALSYALGTLVFRGRVSWPPYHLLSSIYTVAGCLALVGPLVLARGGNECGLGDLLWMTGGLLVWIFDGVAALQGQWRTMTWATPLNSRMMGLTVLAVLLAGWRCRIGARGWSWTNVTGWVLGLFWVGMALGELLDGRSTGLAPR